MELKHGRVAMLAVLGWFHVASGYHIVTRLLLSCFLLGDLCFYVFGDVFVFFVLDIYLFAMFF